MYLQKHDDLKKMAVSDLARILENQMPFDFISEDDIENGADSFFEIRAIRRRRPNDYLRPKESLNGIPREIPAKTSNRYRPNC